MIGGAIDFDRLEEYLRALAHARRLELLHLLQVPHALADVRMTPGKQRAGGSPERPISRQAVQRHLETLQQIGVVLGQVPPGGHQREFVVDRQRVFQVLEELRRVGTITAGAFVSRETVVGEGAPVRRMEPGPKLVLVHGFVEGKVFPLRRDLATNDRWLVGRKVGLSVCLDYDPYVSSVNSEIVREGDDHLVRDLGISRNGTMVNWRHVEEQAVPLKPGDVLGVGRSLLVFQHD